MLVSKNVMFQVTFMHLYSNIVHKNVVWDNKSQVVTYKKRSISTS